MPATPLTPFRLTDEDRARLEAIRAARGFPTMTAAVRDMIDRAYKRLTRKSRNNHAPPPNP